MNVIKIFLFCLLQVFSFKSMAQNSDCDHCAQALIDGTMAKLKSSSDYMNDVKSLLITSDYSEFKKTMAAGGGLSFASFGLDADMDQSQFETKKKELLNKTESKLLNKTEFVHKYGDPKILAEWSKCTEGCEKYRQEKLKFERAKLDANTVGLKVDYKVRDESDFVIILNYTPGPGTVTPSIKEITMSNGKVVSTIPKGDLEFGDNIISCRKNVAEKGCNVLIDMNKANDVAIWVDPFVKNYPNISGTWQRTTDVIGKMEIYTVASTSPTNETFDIKIDYNPSVGYVHTGKGRFTSKNSADIVLTRNYKYREQPCTTMIGLRWFFTDSNSLLEGVFPLSKEKQFCELTYEQLSTSKVDRPLYKK